MVRRVPTAQYQGLAEYRFGLVGTLCHQVDLTQRAVESRRGRPPFDQCVEPVDGPGGISPLRPLQCPLRGLSHCKRVNPTKTIAPATKAITKNHCRVVMSISRYLTLDAPRFTGVS